MKEPIIVQTAVAYQRWQAPNFARLAAAPRPRQEGFSELAPVAVSELSPNALDALAEAWLTDLYANAGRASPFELAKGVRP